MKNLCFVLLLTISLPLVAQVSYGTPSEDQIPEKLKNLRQAIKVAHFPASVDAIKRNDVFHWMHNTSILCLESDITITEFGAYLFYNDQWNFRKSYSLNILDKNFGTKKRKLRQAQPYTWVDNYRTGDTLFGGWALWYFIGTNAQGETVCGYQKLNTTNNLIKS